MFLFCCTAEIVVLTFMRLFCTTPLPVTFDLIHVSGRGMDPLSIELFYKTIQ